MYIFPSRKAALIAADLIHGLNKAGLAQHTITTKVEEIPSEGYAVRYHCHNEDKRVVQAMAYGFDAKGVV